MLMIMAMPYLTKTPKEYICTYSDNQTSSCTPNDFCGDPDVLSYAPNMDNQDSLVNWIERFDLACSSELKINMITVAFFASWLISMLFLPGLADLYGRV